MMKFLTPLMALSMLGSAQAATYTIGSATYDHGVYTATSMGDPIMFNPMDGAQSVFLSFALFAPMPLPPTQAGYDFKVLAQTSYPASFADIEVSAQNNPNGIGPRMYNEQNLIVADFANALSWGVSAQPFNLPYYNWSVVLHTPDGVTIHTPLPAAAWLFGSGLLGLIALRRRKAA